MAGVAGPSRIESTWVSKVFPWASSSPPFATSRWPGWPFVAVSKSTRSLPRSRRTPPLETVRASAMLVGRRMRVRNPSPSRARFDGSKDSVPLMFPGPTVRPSAL